MRSSASAACSAQVAAFLDDLGADALGPRLQRLGHRKTDVAAADDDDAFLLGDLLAEDLQGAVDVLGVGEDVDLVVDEQLIPGLGHEQAAAAPDADDHGAQGREQVGKLPQRRVHYRAVLVQHDAEKLRLAFEETFGVEGRGGRKAAHRSLGDLAFGADHDVDGHVVTAVEVGIDRRQVGLAAQACDLARHRKDRVGHLAGDHVDLVGMGGGDDHVGVARTGAVQNVGIACETGDALHVERVCGAAHQVGVVVDDGDVVALARKVPGDLPADLTRAADDDLHDALSWQFAGPNRWQMPRQASM